MSLTKSQIIVLLLIFLGEALSIYAEMLGAKNITGSFWQVFFKMFIVITFGGALLIAGYMLGFNAFKNIWIVSAISIGTILIVEPILAYTIFQQLPTKGALVGFILGIAGIISATFF
jgi:hypothetical protein